ncbi:dihydrodipicolinate synthase family protein [Cupriavidus sp. a3]|uniref:dihydrodipicolinate synthase family protein n=1 Tax=Cupriavidus sp. a3 TaxID=3242158 RepID=UPI003D9C166C
MKLLLPQTDGGLRPYTLVNDTPLYASVPKAPFNRVVYAAAHVVVDPLRSPDPWDSKPVIDWDTTLAFRDHLWRHGFMIAEAMDTSQRGMGLDWATARELIERSVAHAKTVPGADLACGAGTDQLVATASTTLADVVAAYEEQIQAIEACGGRIILMASRALAQVAKGADDYSAVYGKLLRQCKDKVILHWLGEMFDPELKGYWGTGDLNQAMETVLGIIAENADHIDGIKISLLDPVWEERLRARLPAGIKMFTGDDFNYGELIAGDGEHYSHGLLGIFDPIAPVAAAALSELARGDVESYNRIIAPTVPLGREVFCAPTRYYKAGVVFIAWLNGLQSHFSMVGGMESARSVAHYARVFELADQCGALTDPALALHRMQQFLQVHAGVSS